MALNREQIVETALDLLNEVGMEGLTLRRLAGELGVQAPTLYWHVKNKQQLLDEMATMMLRRAVQRGRFSIDAPWPEAIREMIHSLREMLLEYRDGAKIFSGTYLTDNQLLESMEQPLRLLVDAGFSLEDAVAGWTTLYSFVIGFTIEEQAVRPAAGDPDQRYDPETRAARINASDYPLTVAAGWEMFGNFDERFEQGLRLIIAGMQQQVGIR